MFLSATKYAIDALLDEIASNVLAVFRLILLLHIMLSTCIVSDSPRLVCTPQGHTKVTSYRISRIISHTFLHETSHPKNGV